MTSSQTESGFFILVGAHNCTYNQSMKIEFDPAKAAANPLNHEGVSDL